jgi:hypothetical protein
MVRSEERPDDARLIPSRDAGVRQSKVVGQNLLPAIGAALEWTPLDDPGDGRRQPFGTT